MNRPMMMWDDNLGMCALAQQDEPNMAMLLAYWTSPLPPQECKVGNPCDPTTGDKSQPEADLDLGWVRFDRQYHSLTGTSGGAMGQDGRTPTTFA